MLDLPRTRDEPRLLVTETSAGVVHDLGNLIQIASSAINWLARNQSFNATEAEPIIASARASLERAGSLVHEQLGRTRRRLPQQVDFRLCVKEAVALAGVLAGPQQQITTCVGDVRLDVACDQTGLQCAIINLILNAFQAMPDGGVVALSIETTDQARAILKVADNGVGMDEETVRRAFEPYFTTKQDGAGGLGMVMVDQFVREARGSVSIESTLGAGTTVTLQLPAASG